MLSAEETERIRQIFTQCKPGEFPAEALKIIYDKKLFKLFVPEKFHGLQYSFPEALQVIEACAFADGDFGWAVQIGSGGGFFTGYVEPEIAEKYFSQREFVIAGSGFPSATAQKTENGYRVNGTWKYCSGSSYATLFTANAMLKNSNTMRAFAFLPGEVKIIPNWDAYGMQQTTSDSVRVDELEVPSQRSFDVTVLQEDYGYALYHTPFMVFAKGCILSTVRGCFRHFVGEARNYIASTDEAKADNEELRDLLDASEEELKIWNDKLLQEAQNCWQVLPGLNPEGETARNFEKAVAGYFHFIKERTWPIFQAVGMPATRQNSAINKIWRDLTTAMQHAILK